MEVDMKMEKKKKKKATPRQILCRKVEQRKEAAITGLAMQNPPTPREKKKKVQKLPSNYDPFPFALSS